MQVLGAIGIRAYCARAGISDPDLDSFVRHLWKIADTTNLPQWDAECTRRCDRLLARLAAEQKTHLQLLCSAAYEITGTQMYTNWRPDVAARYLHEVSQLAGIDLDSLAGSEVFLRHVSGQQGWGEPVPPSLLQQWEAVAQQCASPNSPPKPLASSEDNRGLPSVSRTSAGIFDYILNSKTQKVTIEQAEAKHMVKDKRLGKKPIPFGFQYGRWHALRAKMRDGDELWEYNHYVGPLFAEWGIALIRSGEVVDHIVTGMS
jgi:hypothetical protein